MITANETWWRTIRAGRGLDAMIAERAMGWRYVRLVDGEWYGAPAEVPAVYRVPPFSTDVAAAWAVVERLHSLGRIGNTPCDLCVTVSFGDQSLCSLSETSTMGYVGYDGPLINVEEVADTVPLAICRAALAAFGA